MYLERNKEKDEQHVSFWYRRQLRTDVDMRWMKWTNIGNHCLLSRTHTHTIRSNYDKKNNICVCSSVKQIYSSIPILNNNQKMNCFAFPICQFNNQQNTHLLEHWYWRRCLFSIILSMSVFHCEFSLLAFHDLIRHHCFFRSWIVILALILISVLTRMNASQPSA